MATGPIPTIPELRQLLRYEPETGKLFWLPRTASAFDDSEQSAETKCKRWNRRYAGTEALTATCRGYKYGWILKRPYTAHRVAWALATGSWPAIVDHISGNRSDNRIANLREVTAAENARNRGLNPNSQSGVHGVSWSNARKRWQVHIRDEGRQVRIGDFHELEDAIRARREAEANLDYHENHGARFVTHSKARAAR